MYYYTQQQRRRRRAYVLKCLKETAITMLAIIGVAYIVAVVYVKCHA